MKRHLLLISGWAHPGESLREIAELLAGRFEARCYSAAEFAAGKGDLDGLRSPVLLGWSLGGLLALDAARRAGERIGGLVLVSGTARFTRCEGYEAGFPGSNLRAMIRSFRIDPAGALRRFLVDCAAPLGLGEGEIESRLQEALSAGTEELLRGLLLLQDLDLREEVPSIRVPCLFIHGREDGIIPFQASEWMAERGDGRKLVLVEGVGHDLPLRRPGLVAERLAEFAPVIP